MTARADVAQNAQGPWFPLALSPSAPRRAIELAVGSIMLLLDPEDANALIEHDVEHFGQIGLLERWKLAAIAHQRERAGDFDLAQSVYRKFWRTIEGACTLERQQDRFADHFLPHHATVIDKLAEAAGRHGIGEVVELGCGRGEVLRTLMERGIFASGVGVDINRGLIETAQRSTVDPRAHFACADLIDWTVEFGRPGNAYLTSGGVLEFCSPEQLRLLFGHIAQRLRPAVIGLVEPISPDADPENDEQSRPYGKVRSLSHPYPRLLREAGFEVLHRRDYRVGGQRWLMVIAEAA